MDDGVRGLADLKLLISSIIRVGGAKLGTSEKVGRIQLRNYGKQLIPPVPTFRQD